MSELLSDALHLAASAKEASAALAYASGAVKNGLLVELAKRLESERKSILAANAKDIAAAKKDGLPAAMIDRLRLTPARLAAMAEGVRQVGTLPDPVGRTLDGWLRPDGLRLRRIRVPLGVCLIIYESRPDVTVDAAALCLKAGNAAILRGGKEARHSNLALGAVIGRSLAAAGLPPAALQVVRDPDRALVPALLAQAGYIDLAVPRGGRGLVETVTQYARMPVLKHLDGICHVYVDAAADLDMAARIAANAKIQRPGTCNAMETLLVHAAVAPAFLPGLAKSLAAAGVTLHADEAARRIVGRRAKMRAAAEADWSAEYLALELAIAVVPDLDAAIRHINRYGSGHTEAIVTRDLVAAWRFQREVDAASVMVNASTRLADGFEYGLGAEIGISTDKIHARGPVGLEGLTTYKWLVEGDGHIRE